MNLKKSEIPFTIDNYLTTIENHKELSVMPFKLYLYKDDKFFSELKFNELTDDIKALIKCLRDAGIHVTVMC